METRIYRDKTYKAKKVIVIYNNDCHDSDSNYVEVADVRNNKIVTGFKPVSKRFLANFAKQITKSNYNSSNIKGMIPKNMIYLNQEVGNSVYMWSCPKAIRTIYYRDQEFKIEVPTLVFKVVENSLFIYATKTKSVNENTNLYQVSFGNIGASQRVCMGNVRRKNSFKNYVELQESFEHYFFSSVFTDDHRKFDKRMILKTLNLKIKDIL